MRRNDSVAARLAPIILLVALVGLAGCPTEQTPKAKSYTLFAGASLAYDDSYVTGTVILFEGNNYTPIVDPSVVVTMNGQALASSFFGYMGTLTSVAVGQNVTLHFAYDAIDVTQSLPMPQKPLTVTASGTGTGHFDPANPITISWNPMGSPQPDEILVIAYDTVSGEAYEGWEAGSSTSHTIPGGTLIADDFVTIDVSSSNAMTTLGAGELSVFAYSVSNVADYQFIDTSP